MITVPSQWQNNAYVKPQTSWNVDNTVRVIEPDLEAEELVRAAVPPVEATLPAVREQRPGAEVHAPPPPLNCTPFRYICTSDELERFLESVFTKLDGDSTGPLARSGGAAGNAASATQHCVVKDAVALDLEAHSFRSYQGFVCLVQISTSEIDVVIDAISLRSALSDPKGPFIRMLRDPRLVKVMHGADSDILWLQRDFSPAARVVNLFDTARAAQILGAEGFSLAHLIKKHCIGEARPEEHLLPGGHGTGSLTRDKRMFQVADWRVRPLSPCMLHYARWDTHYLLYLYRCLLEELALQDIQNPLSTSRSQQVWTESSRIALRRYTIRSLPADAHLKMARQYKWPLSGSAMQLLQELIIWRDQVARREDESPAYVIPNRFLYALVQQPPRSMLHLERLLRRFRIVRDGCLLSSSPKDAHRLIELLHQRTHPWRGRSRPLLPYTGRACPIQRRVRPLRRRADLAKPSTQLE
ncbi:hypothetical protein CCYA_CCYA06G1711 [Cyanidiococcus yangmingshanensis]|nr:hypothetical protein CCYA_CCYA06G1711 [Cyanidiococcus yangmingshanensis]